MDRRSFVAALAASAFTQINTSHAKVDWPSRQVRYIVSAGPGGSPDVLARTLTLHLEKRLGVRMIVDNRAGGGGNIARQAVLSSPADGHTLYGLTGTESINGLLFPDLPIDQDAFEPVIAAVGSQQVLAFHPQHDVDSVARLIALAKARPGSISLASPSWGTTGQLGVLLLQAVADVRFNPIVYRTASAALPDVIGGHADGIFVTLSAALPHIRSGQLRAIAVATPERAPSLPDVPTLTESGYPALSWTDWQGFAVARGTPEPIVERLNAETNAVLREPAAIAQLEQQGFTVLGGPRSRAVDGLKEDFQRWAPIIQRYGIRPS